MGGSVNLHIQRYFANPNVTYPHQDGWKCESTYTKVLLQNQMSHIPHQNGWKGESTYTKVFLQIQMSHIPPKLGESVNLDMHRYFYKTKCHISPPKWEEVSIPIIYLDAFAKLNVTYPHQIGKKCESTYTKEFLQNQMSHCHQNGRKFQYPS